MSGKFFGDIKCTRAMLLKRQKLLQAKTEVPTVDDVYKFHGNNMGDIMVKNINCCAKSMINLHDNHKVKEGTLKSLPYSKTNDCKRSNIHNEIMALGAVFEEKFDQMQFRRIKKGLEENSRFERFLCEKQIEYYLKEQEKILKRNLTRTNDDSCKGKHEKLQKIYENACGKIIYDLIQEKNVKKQKYSISEKQNDIKICKKNKEVQTNIQGAVKFTRNSFVTPDAEPPIGINETKVKRLLHATKLMANNLEKHLKSQRHMSDNMHTVELLQYICLRKFEIQTKFQDFHKDLAEKIKILYQFLDNIRCELQNVKCKCSTSINSKLCSILESSMNYCKEMEHDLLNKNPFEEEKNEYETDNLDEKQKRVLSLVISSKEGEKLFCKCNSIEEESFSSSSSSLVDSITSDGLKTRQENQSIEWKRLEIGKEDNENIFDYDKMIIKDEVDDNILYEKLSHLITLEDLKQHMKDDLTTTDSMQSSRTESKSICSSSPSIPTTLSETSTDTFSVKSLSDATSKASNFVDTDKILYDCVYKNLYPPNLRDQKSKLKTTKRDVWRNYVKLPKYLVTLNPSTEFDWNKKVME